MTSSHQFIPLQTASMDVSRKLVQYGFTLVKTKRSSSPRLPLTYKEAIYEKLEVDAPGDVDVAVGPDGGAVAHKFSHCGSGPV